MLRNQIIATNDVDRQNQQITDHALFEIASSISSSESATRISVNHDSAMMPMGKVLSGKVVNLGSGRKAVQALLDDFSEEYSQISGPDNEKLYLGYSHNDTRPFSDSIVETDRKIAVSLNPIDFTTESFYEVHKYITESENGEVVTLTKKAAVPEIEIILTVAQYAFAFLLVKKTVNKTTDKLAEKISDDVVSIYDCIKRITKSIFSKLKEKRTLTYVVNAPDQPIELIIQCDNADMLSRAMDEIDCGYISETYQKFTQYLNDRIQKMQFFYDNQNNKWELNYILSNQGQVIGTEKCYNKSVALYRQLMNTPGAGFSIGAPVAYKLEEVHEA